MATGCKKDDLNDPDLIDLGLTDQFTVSTYETFTNTGKRRLWLYMESIEEFGCTNYQIDVSFGKSGNDLLLDIQGLSTIDGEECESGNHRATRKIDLGELGFGEYNVRLKLLDELEESGTLQHTEQQVILSFPADGWMQSPNPQMIKVPENTVWGYFLNASGHYDQLAENYINELEGFGAPLENDGYFGSFRMQQGQAKIIENDRNITTLYTGFGMRYDGDQEVLRAWIDEHYCHLSGKIGLLSTSGDLLPCE